ncbi:MAG: hemerythrin domain-containing protein [Phycisphaeraceae bacterium]|nr:hemerythrin domain-containing protein [Phycisphaeraceae bacterium]
MSRFEHQPLTRHSALAPFSRDHYVGLVQARRLREASDVDDVARRQAVAAFVDAWDTEIAAHFADEERLLAKLLDDADRHRLIEEHGQLRDLAARVRQPRRQTDPPAEILKQLGAKLEQHIRWEERELFGRLQNRMTRQQLVELERLTELVEQSRPRRACRRRPDEESDRP